MPASRCGPKRAVTSLALVMHQSSASVLDTIPRPTALRHFLSEAHGTVPHQAMILSGTVGQ